MSKLTITEAVKIIPVSESTLRRDLKSGKVSFETDAKNRKQIDVSELTRVYGQLKGEPPANASGETAEPVNDTHQNPSKKGNGTLQTPLMTDNDPPKIVALLENQIDDLKTQLESANAEKKELLELANRLQKQNEVLMLPSEADKKPNWLLRLVGVR